MLQITAIAAISAIVCYFGPKVVTFSRQGGSDSDASGYVVNGMNGYAPNRTGGADLTHETRQTHLGWF